jgi:hypothetical protein
MDLAKTILFILNLHFCLMVSNETGIPLIFCHVVIEQNKFYRFISQLNLSSQNK